MVDIFFNALNGLLWFEWGLLGIFGVLYLLKIIYLLLFHGRVVFQKKSIQTGNQPVSLILTFRNEEEYLGKNLPPILSSLKSGSEVVAIDDYSQDNSLSVLGILRKKYPGLKVSSLNEETRYSEKMAKNIALKAASNNWVMILPPKLKIPSNDWITNVSSKMNDEKEVVVNYSNAMYRPGFFQTLFRNECFFQQLKSYGFILNRLPYLNFEENVAFKKEKYFAEGGFSHHIKEHHANFELVLNDFITKKKTIINFCSNSALFKEMSVKKTEYFELLKKEVRIRKNLSFPKRLFLFVEKWLTLLFYLMAAVTFFYFPGFWPVILFLLLFYIFVFAFIIKTGLNRLNERKLFLSSLGYALFIPIFKLWYQASLYYSSIGKK